MAYDTLINALLEEGKAKAEAILCKARADAERVLNETEQACEALDRQVALLIERDLSAQRTAILSRAALSGRRLMLEAKQDVLDHVLSQAKGKTMSLTGHIRSKILTMFLDEALQQVSSQSPRAVIDPREKPYLEGILNERGIPFEERQEDELLLGIKLEVNGEVITNSAAARLAKAKPDLMIELNRLLFG